MERGGLEQLQGVNASYGIGDKSVSLHRQLTQNNYSLPAGDAGVDAAKVFAQNEFDIHTLELAKSFENNAEAQKTEVHTKIAGCAATRLDRGTQEENLRIYQNQPELIQAQSKAADALREAQKDDIFRGKQHAEEILKIFTEDWDDKFDIPPAKLVPNYEVFNVFCVIVP